MKVRRAAAGPEPGEDALDHGRVFDQRDHAHLRGALRAGERIDLVDLADHLRPRDFRGLACLAAGFRAGLVNAKFGTEHLAAAASRITVSGREENVVYLSRSGHGGKTKKRRVAA